MGQETRQGDVLTWLGLLTGARPVPDADLARLLERLPAQAWDAVLQAAVHERLAPLMTAHLRRRGALRLVPGFVQEALQAEYRRNQLYYSLQVYSLGQLSADFRAAGIPFRLLKGLAVAAQVYAPPVARAVGDLDLWIGPGDLDAALGILRARGFRRNRSPYSEAFVRAFYGQQEWTAQAGSPVPAWIDLHWHLINAWWLRDSLRVPEAALFARAVPISLNGDPYLTLDPTDTLYYLCLHVLGGLHALPWKCLMDIHLLAQQPAISWPLLRARAAESGLGVLVWRAFAVIDSAFGSSHGARLGPPPPAWQRALLARLAAVPQPGDPLSIPRDADMVLPILPLLPGPAAMCGALGRILWPSRRWLYLRHGPAARGSAWRARLRHLARRPPGPRQEPPGGP